MINTEPNDIYEKWRHARKACVEKAAFEHACYLVGAHAGKLTLSNPAEARWLFDRVRRIYWIRRGQTAARGEFNSYNRKRMAQGKAPIGPDGFPIELDHIEELHANPSRALDPENIREVFKRQHDFQHGNYGFRWSIKRLPRSPWGAGLSRDWGTPENFTCWP